MIRSSEMVLPGHPDKFCDQVADAIVAACYEADPEAYCQVEASVWSDQVWLSGCVATRQPLPRALDQIVRDVGRGIGYVEGNAIDADRYRITSTVCAHICDPRRWTRHVNDQSIVIGWAGYDARTRFLPPEHFLAHVFREALTASCRTGRLIGEGPDGKLLIRVREDTEAWALEHVLVTLQHRAATPLIELCQAVNTELANAYSRLRSEDRRWSTPWEQVELLVNPNGPMLNGGSDGDNGQTGRKLVMDFYGPRVPIGGGALSGKDLSHIDRLAAYTARHAAVLAVRSGAPECKVQLTYAPNVDKPLDVSYEMSGRGRRQPAEWFTHAAMLERIGSPLPWPNPGAGLHFWDQGYVWNGCETGQERGLKDHR